MRQVLLISNDRAGSVSTAAREVIVKALAADFKLDVAHTTRRDHASDLAEEGVDRGFDAVVVFGGDGTVNEAAQPLVATDVAFGILPGGTTNVMAKILGIPRDPIEATAFLAQRLRERIVRRIGVGRVNARYFLFSAGMGLDAEVVKRVEADPAGKRSRPEWTYLKNALRAGTTEYRGKDTKITLELDGHDPARLLFCVCANARPLTFFKGRPVDALPDADLETRLDFFGLDRVTLATVPRIAWSVFVSRSHPGWKHGHYFRDIASASWRAVEPMPVQVDGDYIGDWDRAVIRHVADALDVVA
ncbi:MAG: diacylglycerol kinase family lipid kinase [Actinomycetota bacterium]|nr:diacylglycerol kinase family lipid kinase [Actinomycetota bacterium]